MTTVSAREFNRDVSAAKRDAARGPVVITDRGKPARARGRAGIARLGRRDVEQAQRLRTCLRTTCSQCSTAGYPRSTSRWPSGRHVPDPRPERDTADRTDGHRAWTDRHHTQRRGLRTDGGGAHQSVESCRRLTAGLGTATGHRNTAGFSRLLLLRQPVPERVLTVRVVQQVQGEFVAEALEGRTAADAGAVGVQPR